MRKWLGPVGVMFLMAGLVVAAEGTISKVDLFNCTFRNFVKF